MEPQQRQPLRLLLIAACCGVLCGLGEGGIYWVLRFVPDWLGWRNDLVPEILWIAPLADTILFLGIGVLLIPLSRVLPRVRDDILAYAILGGLAIYGPLAASGKLHQLTCTLIAVGMTVQICRYAQKRAPLSLAWLARGFVALSISVVILSVLGVVLQSDRSAAADRRAATADAARPNVLLITLDTLRADHVSAYGYTRPTTPTIDRLAREGVLFENAFATASWTLPSHASILTGRYPYEHRADGRPLDGRYPTLAEALASHGYVTAAFSANAHYVTPRAGFQRGFEHFEVYYGSLTDMWRRTFFGKTLLDRLPWLGYYDIPGRKRATQVNHQLFRWLATRPPAPFFAFLNYFDVHDPYVAPRPYQTRFSERVNRGSRINSEMIPDLFTPPSTENLRLSAEEIQLEVDGYDASLAYLDAELGTLFARLSSEGILDNTIVIVTSDHGESFGEHQLYGHGNGLYRNILHVPLIVRFPSTIPAGQRVSAAVSLQAIPATVMTLLGLAPGAPFPGRSLSESWKSGSVAAGDDAALAFGESLPEIFPGRKGGPVKSLSTSQWQLIIRASGQVELFRSDRDPLQLANLADTPEGRAMVAKLGSRMEGFMSPKDWRTFQPIIAQRGGQ